MMYKSVLTVICLPADAEAAITAAAQISTANDGHLDVLALGVDHTQAGYSYIGAGAVLMQVSVDRAEADARAAEAAARKALAEQGPDLRWSLETAISQVGTVADVVANTARFVDLVVLPRPYGPGRGVDSEAVVEASLFEGHAPVLILPDDAKAMRLAAPRRIAIAWNQSAEAMNAVRKALPLLKAADMVDITVVDPPSHGPERSDPGGMLCQMLVRHGVKAEVSVLARSLPRVSEVLMQHTTDINADLLVMGAYGHSRLREAVLGGATRSMLEKSRIPVFMAH